MCCFPGPQRGGEWTPHDLFSGLSMDPGIRGAGLPLFLCLEVGLFMLLLHAFALYYIDSFCS